MCGGVGGGMGCSVAHFRNAHEQTQLNRVCYLRFFDVALASKRIFRTYWYIA